MARTAHRSVCWGLALALYLSSAIAGAAPVEQAKVSTAQPLEGLHVLGEGELSVLWWRIYRARLYSEQPNALSGRLALALRYQRNIRADELLTSTREEWQRLQVPYQPRWLEQLKTLWPDVDKGDELLLVITRDQRSDFYYNGQLLGSLHDPLFGRAFLSIWLAPDTRDADLRAALTAKLEDVSDDYNPALWPRSPELSPAPVVAEP